MAIFHNENVMKSAAAAAYSVDNSLKFDDGTDSYLYRDFSSDWGTTGCYSFWIKRCKLGTIQRIILNDTASSSDPQDGSGTYGPLVYFLANDTLDITSGANHTLSRVYRDVSGWHHFFIKMTTTGGAELWVNGEASTDTYANGDWVTTPNMHLIGVSRATAYGSSSHKSDFYLADFHCIDGTAAYTDFAETDSNGQWVPKEYADSYGTNGFRIDFSDSADLGADAAGSNDFTTVNLVASDQMIDTPSAGKNFCVMNPLDSAPSEVVLSEGNLGVAWSGASGYSIRSSIAMPPASGKWYCEIRWRANCSAGIIDQSKDIVGSGAQKWPGANTYGSGGSYAYVGNGFRTNSGSVVNALAAADGDIVGLLYDATNATFSASINGGAFTEGFPYSGEAAIDTTKHWCFAIGFYGGTTTDVNYFNFGADHTFAGAETALASPYQDSNSVGEFWGTGSTGWTFPSGAKALCTASLADPGVNNAVAAETAFSTKLYTGSNGSSETGLGFQPDLTWLKSRTTGYSHIIGDSVRGSSGSAMYFLASNGDAAEGAETDKLVSLDTDGFTVGSHAGAGLLNTNYVAWNWKGGTTKTGAYDPTGTLTPVKEEYNAAAGFSIITYEGSVEGGGTDGTDYWDTIPHSLGAKPEMIIIKNRDEAESWAVYHKDLTTDYDLALDTSAAQATNGLFITSAADHTASLFTIRADDGMGMEYPRVNGEDMFTSTAFNFIAYLFASIPGYSQIGSYVANNTSGNGPFVYCGFRPALVIVKNIDAGANASWLMFDSKRDGYNKQYPNEKLEGDTSYEEDGDGRSGQTTGTANGIDMLSNGFKIRGGNWTELNYSTHNYIYCAVAENPFKHANAR